MRCDGQFIAVEAGRFDWLHLLTASERRAEDVVEMHFADGSVDPEWLRVSDFWAAPAWFGEATAFATPVMHYPHHVQRGVSAMLWSQRVPVTRRADLSGFRLPRNAAVHVFAATLQRTAVPEVAMTSDFATPTTTSPTDSVPVEAPLLWYRDPISCLQSTFASVLDRAGVNPLVALGAGWGVPVRPGRRTVGGVLLPLPLRGRPRPQPLPHHDVSSSWWCPADPDDPLREIREAMTEGRLVIAAVDNFHLPFRPAFGDVHAAHLLVVYGLDERRGLVHVSDAMPPAFQGPIPLDDFLNSWGSANPQDHQDAFFSDSEISRRCLSVSVGSLGGAAPTPDPSSSRAGCGATWSGSTTPAGSPASVDWPDSTAVSAR